MAVSDSPMIALARRLGAVDACATGLSIGTDRQVLLIAFYAAFTLSAQAMWIWIQRGKLNPVAAASDPAWAPKTHTGTSASGLVAHLMPSGSAGGSVAHLVRRRVGRGRLELGQGHCRDRHSAASGLPRT